ncbi:MAG: LUD domain-containing protein [Candidatus Micrarchaeaceae archaeon]
MDNLNYNMINKFVYYSELVGNTNTIINKNEFINLLSDDYEYINLPSFKKLKELIIDEKGIKRAIIEASYAIAETGSVVINSKDELLRRATSLSEELDIVVFKSKIVDRLEDMKEFMRETTQENAAYITFVTGASRTADIELVLAMGVHGPLKVNIIIISDK